MSAISQTLAVTGINLRTLPQRRGASIVAVLGIAGVVLVTIGVFSIARGFAATMADRSEADTAMVLRASATSEMDSRLSGEELELIRTAPGVAQGAGGALVSGETFVIVDIPRKSTNTASNVPLRGVELTALAARGNVEIVAGRMFGAGLNEIIVGQGAQNLFSGLDLGTTVRWGRNEWQVVGVFSAAGGVAESEVWADVKVLNAAYQRGNSVQTARVKLQSPEAMTQFSDTLTADPRLEVMVKSESEFYADQSEFFSKFVAGIGFGVGMLMGLGALFSAVNTMYNTVASRTRDIATLRALGFHGGPVAVSILIEAMLLALVGGLLGALLGWAVFNGMQVATLNWQSFSQVTFAFRVDGLLIRNCVIFAVVIGFLGGLLPSLRAASTPITTALREL